MVEKKLNERVDESDGKKLVRLARKIIEAHFEETKIKIPDLHILNEERGIFVTLKTHPKNILRGCIGYIEGIMPLRNSIIEIALASALNDPRFAPVKKNEIENLLVEVSVLTKPVLIKAKNVEDYPDKIDIGSDGLIIECGVSRGLLLPQVPVEWRWNAEEFLSQTCMKAGLSPGCWRRKEEKTKIYKFSADVFSEEEPNGKTKKVVLK